MTPTEGTRLDTLLVDRGLARSRGEAQTFILEGRVRVDGEVASKPGRHVPPDAPLAVDWPETRYVSRGGLKLAKALDTFGVDVAGLVCVDIGASTGGFVDCLLGRQARRVYAVDVGYGLLAWSLRTDPRVVPLDRTNARYLTRESFRQAAERELGKRPEPAGFLRPSFATCDVSFISLLKVVPAVATLLDEPWQMVLLVKPQFEAGREKVGSKGVVRDPAAHREVLERVIGGLGRPVLGLTYSPVRGPEGNIEYLLWTSSGPGQTAQVSADTASPGPTGPACPAAPPSVAGPSAAPAPPSVDAVVAEAFEHLK